MSKSAKLTRYSVTKYIGAYFAYLLIIWGFYRLIVQLPEEIEEFILKPLIWLVPLFVIVFKKEKLGLESLGITFKNLFPAIYFSFALGAIFAIEGILINFAKYQTFNFSANLGEKLLIGSLVISIATAISEEISFRGYIYNRLEKVFANELTANIITTILWTAIHVPIVVFVWKMTGYDALAYLSITAIFGLGSSFIFAKTQNVFSSILLHILWQWPIILFR